MTSVWALRSTLYPCAGTYGGFVPSWARMWALYSLLLDRHCCLCVQTCSDHAGRPAGELVVLATRPTPLLSSPPDPFRYATRRPARRRWVRDRPGPLRLHDAVKSHHARARSRALLASPMAGQAATCRLSRCALLLGGIDLGRLAGRERGSACRLLVAGVGPV